MHRLIFSWIKPFGWQLSCWLRPLSSGSRRVAASSTTDESAFGSKQSARGRPMLAKVLGVQVGDLVA